MPVRRTDIRQNGIMPSLPSSFNNSASAPLSRASKTLTPQRKHRKMLKDGSSEVWPESVETIFVSGLRKYWDSPWATFSRGRSRWRNQFLVDYLQEKGIERTKKQVASHIQVLRNMWKGEDEYKLVAGGEELYLDSGLPALRKSRDRGTGAAGVSIKQEQHTLASLSFPSTPSSSTSDRIFDVHVGDDKASLNFGSLPIFHYNESPIRAVNSPFRLNDTEYVKDEGNDDLVSPCSDVSDISLKSRVFPQWQPTEAVSPMNVGSFSSPFEQESLPAISSAARFSSARDHTPLNHQFLPDFFPDFNPDVTPIQPLCNRVTKLSVWAEGMLAHDVYPDFWDLGIQPNMDVTPAVIVHLRLSFSSLEDPYSDPGFHGFQGAITLASPWGSSARCTTSQYDGSVLVQQEVGMLALTQSPESVGHSPHTLTALLPESSLSRSRWIDTTRQICIIQQITVDEAVLAIVIYELERKGCGSLPSARTISLRKYPRLGKSTAQNSSILSTSSHPSPNCGAQNNRNIRHFCATEPVPLQRTYPLADRFRARQVGYTLAPISTPRERYK